MEIKSLAAFDLAERERIIKQNVEELSAYFQTDNTEYSRLAYDKTNRPEEITTIGYLNALILA